MKAYKIWVRTIYIGFLLFSLTIVLFNYYVDSFNLFNKNNDTMGRDLLNGYYITGENISSNRVDNIYEYMIKDSNKTDFLAIGSSRAIGLHKDLLFNNMTVKYLNFTDGTANLKHYAKIIGLFNKYNKVLPKNIILGIDPWVFDQSISIRQLKRLINYFPNGSMNYSQLINYEYTKLNALSLLNNGHYQKSRILSDLLNENNKEMVISPDGDLYHPADKNSYKEEKVLSEIKIGLHRCDEENYNTKCVKYKSLNNFNEMKYIIDYLKNQKVNIYVYFAPFEPTFYNHIVKNNNFLNHSKKIREFFINNDIGIIGSYSPYDYNLTTKYFSDGIHPKSVAIKIIFENKKF